MLRIDIHAVHPKVTLRCSGRIVLGVEAETLRCIATSRTESHLALDLCGISTVDAAGLGLLVELQCWANEQKKALQIVNGSVRVRKLIALTNLQSILGIAALEQLTDADGSDSVPSRDCLEGAMSA